jgi:hypothetical protein
MPDPRARRLAGMTLTLIPLPDNGLAGLAAGRILTLKLRRIADM